VSIAWWRRGIGRGRTRQDPKPDVGAALTCTCSARGASMPDGGATWPRNPIGSSKRNAVGARRRRKRCGCSGCMRCAMRC
jgi:hypothetical protein